MATENPRVWFKSISLENVRSFGEKQTIYFTDDGTETGNAARWNVILGDNGTGKTTILKSLWIGNSSTDRRNHSLLYGLLRNDSKQACVGIRYEHYHRGVIRPTAQMLIRFNITDPELLVLKDKTQLWYESSEGELAGFDFYGSGLLYPFAYGAARKIGSSAISKEIDYSIATLFNEEDTLINAEEWLLKAEYISLKNILYKERFEKVIYVLKKIFRDQISDIYITADTGTPKVFFKTHYGDVRLHELSLGYKTLIAWMVDFAKGLLDRYPDSPDPLAEPAVCLVDEIDLHLHPKFQRTIIKFLTDTFPSTQFIVTAHSPLIVVAAEEKPDANIILLKREGNRTVVVNDPIDVSNWSVDQILNSDLFGHVSASPEPLTELRTERDTLLAKPKLTKKDSARLTELDAKIGFVPFGQDQAEIKAESIIQQLADVLRKQQQAQ